MQPIIFDPLKHQKYLKKYRNQLIANDFLYKIGSKIILDCAIRSSNRHNNLLLYGYFGNEFNMFKKVANNITYAFIIPIHQDRCLCTREEELSFTNNSFNMAFSNLSLHFANDLPKALSNYHQILEENSLFIVTIIGDYSFFELRESFAYADEKIYSGMSIRVMPMIKSESLLRLIQRVGFSHPVLHKETIILQYDNLLNLLRDLRKIGFGNFLANSTSSISKNFLSTAEDYYFQHHAIDAKLNLSVDITTLSVIKSSNNVLLLDY